ncbi:gem-associated protein 5 [Nasonia vitripennis]|uniref:Gem-associated protein 5 n=1 Tax=Nasonia vitripennis TaxID=7425 RepID=A0A7M7QC87_NASVI|nr:gem-associated protein 5 [Nasonia vitripennis]
MNELVLPPSPNWYLSNILACASDGTVAWGARNSIVVAKAKETCSKSLEFSIIDRAHTDRVTCLSFSPKHNEAGFHRLVSSGDDNIVKIWSLQDLNLEMKNSTLTSQKVIGVDWSKHNPNLVCFVSEDGLLVTWNISYDASQTITLGGKLAATCLACCPHDSNLVALGFKSGLVYLVDLRGSGSVTWQMRGHNVEITSLSWCPAPVNIFESKETKEFLLASGAKDRDIFLWKTDGRYQTQITLPVAPLDSSSHKCKVSASAASHTAVCWLEPTVLLTSSPWGELLMWDLNASTKKKFTPKLIHAKHGRGLFSITGLAVEPPQDKESENWRSKTNIQAIWTLAQDRQVVCCSILDSETCIEYTIPTQGGFVYCMSACPVDTSQIAFGVGDAMIRLWNLSEPHETTIQVQMLWEKIMGKVRALSWHPEKENLLAFATNEGRVGTFDTNSRKPPILLRQYHRRIIYSIGWGPAPNVKEYALYTCGDGELVYYNLEKLNDNPVPVVKKKDCTEFCWKPDYSLLALGFGDGSISFLNRDLKEYGSTINLLHKAIQCLTWHPESTSSDLNISAMQNYLAVAINGSAINIFDILTCDPEENKSDQSSFYRTVATLNGHSEKVVCLSWSPHISGYLVSGSYDNTAKVWKIETQQVIATYASHLRPIQCCMWSPFNQDLIITGSADSTLRIWSISNQTVAIPASSVIKPARGKRTKKKKTKEAIITNNANESESKQVNGESIVIAENKQETVNPEPIKKKKQKKITHFPGYSEILNDSNLWYQSVRKLLHILKFTRCTQDVQVPVLLGSKTNLEEALNHEKKILESNGQYNAVTEINLWSGNLKENLEEAMKSNRLNDYLVSLAFIEPSITIETREKVIQAYVNQLIFQDNPHKAVSYLLCINKVHEAVDVLMASKIYKEAYALATLKLEANDPLINSILEEWANNAVKNGNFESAAECYIMLGEYVKAAKTLERRRDIDSLILAIELAEIARDVDLITSVADKAILEALFNSEFATAKSIIENHPQMQFREIEVQVFTVLSEILASTSDEIIFDWLKGLSSSALLETLENRFAKCPNKYLFLLEKDVYPLTDSQNEKMVQIRASHQIALAILSDNQKQQLQHIVKACDVISQYEKSSSSKSLLAKYLVSLEKKNWTDSSSILNTSENGVSSSLRAYLCHAIIKWFNENSLKLKDEQICESANLIVSILENCVQDLLSKQAVEFWNTTNEINKLEAQLSLEVGQVPSSATLIEQLDQLKKAKNKFLDERISAPNPLSSHHDIMEFLSQVPDKQACQKITQLVMATSKTLFA